MEKKQSDLPERRPHFVGERRSGLRKEDRILLEGERRLDLRREKEKSSI